MLRFKIRYFLAIFNRWIESIDFKNEKVIFIGRGNYSVVKNLN